MRLIDADALLECYDLKNAVKYGNETKEQQHHSYSTMMMYEIADMIEDAPTIDAVPVARGSWRPDGSCTHCDCVARWPHSDYCPHCGARMDGGDGA